MPTPKEHWAKLIEAFQPRHPKLAELMLCAEDDVLAYKTFPQAHWRQIHSTNPLTADPPSPSDTTDWKLSTPGTSPQVSPDWPKGSAILTSNC
ncbi:MAG: hypothetical protein ACJARR_004001 [Pseudophaeobacter arcticus]|uniref:transposase n=1 Tax=Pseudophaeobacter arcticus TaxID=385492 RepID=UPI0004244FBB